MKFGALRWCLGISAALVSATAMAATGGDSLIVVGNFSGGNFGRGSGTGISGQVNSRIALTQAVQTLKPLYSTLDVIDAATPTEAQIISKIQARKQAAHVDVFVLSVAVGRSPLKSVRAPNLRLVYLSGNSSGSTPQALLEDWQKLGARLTIAQKDSTETSTLSTVRFLHAWGRGSTAQDAAKQAQDYSAKISQTLADFAHETSAPALYMTGVNVDRRGGEHEYMAVAVPSTQSTLQTVPVYRTKTAFQAAAVAATSALVPSVDVNTAAVPGAQALIDRMQPFAWDQLQSLFASGINQQPAVDTDPVAQEVWVDGEFLKYMAEPLKTWVGGKLAPAIDRISGIKLTRRSTGLLVSLYFSGGFDIVLKDASQATTFQPYAVHVPKTMRADISDQGGTLTLDGVDAPQGEEQDQLFVSVKIPVISDKVYLRKASIDLASGQFIAEAGILGDVVGLVAHAQIAGKQFKPQIDLWKTIQDNESLFEWPVLEFEREL